MRGHRGFTLIELLIVIAIIAILALIAIPNFLEAQVRAKISRAQTDMRSIATAIESYYLDYNSYPLVDTIFNVVPHTLSTPIAYITAAKLVDPFSVNLKQSASGGNYIDIYYTYKSIFTSTEYSQLPDPPKSYIFDDSIDDPDPFMQRNPGARQKYGFWKMVSKGPDQVFTHPGTGDGFGIPLRGSDLMYDPSNGTISYGNIIRTQISPTGPKAIK